MTLSHKLDITSSQIMNSINSYCYIKHFCRKREDLLSLRRSSAAMDAGTLRDRNYSLASIHDYSHTGSMIRGQSSAASTFFCLSVSGNDCPCCTYTSHQNLGLGSPDLSDFDPSQDESVFLDDYIEFLDSNHRTHQNCSNWYSIPFKPP